MVLGQFLDPVHLELGLLLLCVPNSVAVDDYEPRVAAVVAVLLDEAACEQLHVAIFGDELAVVLVEYEVFARPVLEFGVEAVAHDEHTGFLVVVDAMADVDAHEHGVLAFLGRDDEVVFVFELNHPRGLVHQFAGDFIHYVVHDRVQFVFIRVFEELHVVLLVLFAELRVFITLLGLIFATFLVTEKLGYCVFSYYLNNSFFVENMEYFEFLVQMRQKFRYQQNYYFIVPYQLVNQHFPILIIIMIDK